MNHREYSSIIEQARKKLQELTREVDDKRTIIAELDLQSKVARQSLELVEQNLQDKKQEKKRLDNEITKRQENIEDIDRLLKETLKISPEEKQALANSELANLKQEIEHHKNELSHLKEKYQEVSHGKQEIRQEISKQEELTHKLRASIAQLNARKVAANEIINGLKARYKELKTEFLDLQNNKADLDRRVLEVKQKNPSLSSLEELQSEIEKLISEKQTLTRQTADFKSQIEDLVIKKEALADIPSQLETNKLQLDTIIQKVTLQQESVAELQFQEQELKEKTEKLEVESQTFKQQLSEAKAQVIVINAQKEQLVETNSSLADRKQQLETAIPELCDREREIQRRVAAIEEQNPNLDNLEELQKQTEQIRLEKSGLEGAKEALQSQVERLATKKDELQIVEAQLLPKQTELKAAIAQIEQLKTQTKDLEKQATELELLRATYDTLSAEKNNFKIQIDRLRPEIAGLEAQKQQILQAIRENESEYSKVEQQREELRRLNSQIGSKYAEYQNLKRDVAQIQGVSVSLAEDEAKLKAEITRLEKYLKQLQGEIEGIENGSALALQALRTQLWQKQDIPLTARQIDITPAAEQQFVSGLAQYLTDCGLTFSSRVINAFHTSLKVQDISALVILAGISGTGKSQLPQHYGEYIGAQSLTLAVQPRWDSPQDLQGFYNYIEKKYKPTDLMRGLYQYQHDPNMSDRLVMVLLDEMNLARVEYYFSDFLSKLENKTERTPYLDLDVGSLSLPENERKLAVPQQFLFVGTMNEDETTQSLSDKVLDRANVLTFGKPEKLKLREEFSSNKHKPEPPQDYITYSQFQSWMKKPDPNSELVNRISNYLERANAIMDKLGHPFAHRVYQAITGYVVNYPGVVEGNKEAFNSALADQFGQKLLPKLRGLMLDECGEELNEFSRLIEEIGDEALIKAFAVARNGHFGQFHWRGFIYPELQSKSMLLSD